MPPRSRPHCVFGTPRTTLLGSATSHPTQQGSSAHRQRSPLLPWFVHLMNPPFFSAFFFHFTCMFITVSAEPSTAESGPSCLFHSHTPITESFTLRAHHLTLPHSCHWCRNHKVQALLRADTPRARLPRLTSSPATRSLTGRWAAPPPFPKRSLLSPPDGSRTARRWTTTTASAPTPWQPTRSSCRCLRGAIPSSRECFFISLDVPSRPTCAFAPRPPPAVVQHA